MTLSPEHEAIVEKAVKRLFEESHKTAREIVADAIARALELQQAQSEDKPTNTRPFADYNPPKGISAHMEPSNAAYLEYLNDSKSEDSATC